MSSLKSLESKSHQSTEFQTHSQTQSATVNTRTRTSSLGSGGSRSPGSSPGSPSRINKRYLRRKASSLKKQHTTFKDKLKSLKYESVKFAERVLPLLKEADHSEHTEEDLKQAAMELWSRNHQYKDKLEAMLANPEKLRVEINDILPPVFKHHGCYQRLLICRHQVNIKLHQTYIGLGWEFLIMFFSLVTIANYVLETYAESSSYSYEMKLSIIIIDIVCNSVFAIDFIVQTLTSHPWYNHISTTDGFIDFVTVTPFIMTLSIYGLSFPTFNCRPPGVSAETFVNECAPNYAPNLDPIGIITFLRFTRILKNIRLLREARLIKIFRMIFHFDMASSRLVALSIGVLGTFTLATSIIYLVENEIENYLLAYYKVWSLPEPEADYECYTHSHSRDASCGLSWINSFYMIVVTFTTVGYGDFSPRSDFAQIVMIFILLGGVAWLSSQISRANTIIAAIPKHKKEYKSNSDENHICLLGGFSRPTLMSFLEEHFHPDHRTPGSTLEAENVVIMQPHPAPGWLRHLLVHHDRAAQLHYYHGSIYSTNDLRAISLHDATHCFIFANVHSTNLVKDDANAVVHATALKSWTESVKNPPPLHIQVHLESTRRRLAKLSRNGGMHDVCVDIDGLKARIFGHNFMCPGASTFLENLFTSFAGSAGVQNHEHHSADGEVDDEEQEWLQEYYHGCGQELYTTKAPLCLSGTLFRDAVIAVFLGHVKRDDNDTSRTPDGVIVVGVVEHPHLTTSGREVIINPGKDYCIKPHSHLIIIADDKSKATALSFAHNMPSFCRAGGMVLYALSSRARKKLSSTRLSAEANSLTDDGVELNAISKRDSITAHSLQELHNAMGGANSSISRNLEEEEDNNEGVISDKISKLGESFENDGRSMFSHVQHGKTAKENELGSHDVNSLMERMDDMHNKISALLPNLHLTSSGGSLEMWRRLDGYNGGRLTEWPILQDHIIICGDLRRLPEFVLAIREGIPLHLGDHEAIVEVPIVCLSTLDDITANKLWGLTSGAHDPEVLREVYQARGDPSNDNDLRSCSLENASCVLILGNASNSEIENEDNRNIESTILTAYFSIQTELAFMPHKHVRVAVETQWSMAMSMLDNMRQMFHYHKKQHHRKTRKHDDEPLDSCTERHGHPLHGNGSDDDSDDDSGNEDNGNGEENGCCATLFNHHHLHHKIQKHRHERNSFMAGPLYAAGGAISARFFDTFLCQTMFTPEVLDFLFACVSFREDHDTKGIGDRALLQLEVMDHLVGKEFQQLFSLMLKKYGLLCVGLYRSHRSKSRRADGLPYVLTSPSPDTVIRKNDRVFVLATFPLIDKAAYMADQFSSARDLFSSASSYQHGREQAVTHVERVERKKSLYSMAKRASLANRPSLMNLIAAAQTQENLSDSDIEKVKEEIRKAEVAKKAEDARVQGERRGKKVNTLKL
jgi:voltage-gated potassium channel Kch